MANGRPRAWLRVLGSEPLRGTTAAATHTSNVE